MNQNRIRPSSSQCSPGEFTQTLREDFPNATIVFTGQKHVLVQRAIAEETEDKDLDADLSHDGDQGMSALLTLNTLLFWADSSHVQR